MRPDDGEEIDTFQHLLEFNRMSKKSNGEEIMCTANDMKNSK